MENATILSQSGAAATSVNEVFQIRDKHRLFAMETEEQTPTTSGGGGEGCKIVPVYKPDITAGSLCFTIRASLENLDWISK